MTSSLFDPIEKPAHGAPSTTATIQFTSVPFRDHSPAIFPPPCATCQFPLPFRLLLRDGLVKVALAGQPLVVFIRETRQEAYDKRTVIAKVEGMDLAPDRSGIIRFSDVEVQFPYDVLRNETVAKLLGFEIRDEPPVLDTQWLDSLHPEVQRVSLFAVNRLLQAYRFLSGEHYVRPITLSDIYYMQTGWIIPQLASPFSMAIGAQNQAITLQAHSFSDQFHHTLAQRLADERDVPIWSELVMDAREHLEVGRLRHVVIDSRTALEVFVDQTLLACFTKVGLSVGDVALTLRLSKRIAQSIKSIEEAISLARINDKLKYGIRRALGIQLARRRVWKDWLAAKEARESSVHYGGGVSEQLAKLSLTAVEEMMNAIHMAGSPVSQTP